MFIGFLTAKLSLGLPLTTFTLSKSQQGKSTNKRYEGLHPLNDVTYAIKQF